MIIYGDCGCTFCTKLKRYFPESEMNEYVRQFLVDGKVTGFTTPLSDDAPLIERLQFHGWVHAIEIVAQTYIGSTMNMKGEANAAISMMEAADVIRQLTALDAKVEANG